MSTSITIHSCKKTTEHVTKNKSHVLHLLLTVISFGIWIPIWVLVLFSDDSACSQCGKRKGTSMAVFLFLFIVAIFFYSLNTFKTWKI